MGRPDVVSRVRREVGRVVQELEATRDRLERLAAELPVAPEEADPDRDLDTLDEAAGLRSVLACVVHDRLRPAIEDLLVVSVI